jgi:hypothetical protein
LSNARLRPALGSFEDFRPRGTASTASNAERFFGRTPKLLEIDHRYMFLQWHDGMTNVEHRTRHPVLFGTEGDDKNRALGRKLSFLDGACDFENGSDTGGVVIGAVPDRIVRNLRLIRRESHGIGCPSRPCPS